MSLRGYVLTGDKPGIHGRVGLGYNVLGEDRGEFSADLGVSYLLDKGFLLVLWAFIILTQRDLFRWERGVGLSSVKKDKNGEVGEEPLKCVGGTWNEEGECECPDGYFPVGFLEGFECSKPL